MKILIGSASEEPEKQWVISGRRAGVLAGGALAVAMAAGAWMGHAGWVAAGANRVGAWWPSVETLASGMAQKHGMSLHIAADQQDSSRDRASDPLAALAPSDQGESDAAACGDDYAAAVVGAGESVARAESASVSVSASVSESESQFESESAKLASLPARRAMTQTDQTHMGPADRTGMGPTDRTDVASPSSPLPVASPGEREVRANLASLAERLGRLQAQLVALDSTNRRLLERVQAQDLAFGAIGSGRLAMYLYQDRSESTRLLEAGELSGARALAHTPLRVAPSAEVLGRQIDAIDVDLGRRQDLLATLELALLRRAAAIQRLPTGAPIVDYPYLSSSYGWRRHPIKRTYVMHDGLDFAAPRGTPVLATGPGVVRVARAVSGYGNMIEIDHGGDLVTRYAHASRLRAKAGDIVKRGQHIADVGSTGLSTGPHLHYEVRVAGEARDPRQFLPPASAQNPLVADRAQAG